MRGFLIGLLLSLFLFFYATAKDGNTASLLEVEYVVGELFPTNVSMITISNANVVMEDDSKFLDSKEIEDKELDDSLYMYRSYTKWTHVPIGNSFRQVQVQFDSGNNSDFVLMGSNKKGYILNMKNVYTSNIYTAKTDGKLEKIDKKNFEIKNISLHKEDSLRSLALCEFNTKLFVPSKVLCFPSLHSNINFALIQNNELSKLEGMMDTSINNSNYKFMRTTRDYLNRLFGINLENGHLNYYLLHKTILCNVNHMLKDNIKFYDADGRITQALQDFSDDMINANNEFVLLNEKKNQNPNGKFLIWKHEDADLVKDLHRQCKKFFFNQGLKELYLNNMSDVYESSLYSNSSLEGVSSILPNEKDGDISSVSSWKEYTLFYYKKYGKVMVLKNFKLVSSFQLNDIEDLVLHRNASLDMSFYYLRYNGGRHILQVFSCTAKEQEQNVRCALMSFIPYKKNNPDEKVYISTVQSQDTGVVFISTPNEIWRINLNEEEANQRNLINKIKKSREGEEYFGDIQCYSVIKKHGKKMFSRNMYEYDQNGKYESIGCTYFKHFKDSSKSMLISYLDTGYFVQFNYFVVRDKKFIVSSGDITVSFSEQSMPFRCFIYLFCIILLVLYLIYTKFISPYIKGKRGKRIISNVVHPLDIINSKKTAV